MNVASDTLTEEKSAAAESKTQGNRAGRKMPRLSQNGIGENLRTGVYWIARLWFRGVFYGRTLRGRRPQALTMIPEENWPGRSDRGARLVDGRFRFLNHTVSAEDLAAGKSDTGPSWQAEYHSFDWLRDMRAVGTEAARVRARTYVTEWMVANQKWHPVSWRPDILARRVCNWLTYAEFISAGADGDFAEKFLDNIARQIRHLRRAGRFVPNGVDRMLVTKSLIYAALCLPNSIRFVPRQIKAVTRMSERQVLPDGGHLERNPASQMQALRHLIDIRSVLGTSSIEIPEALQRAIDRAAPMLSFYRHGDGGLALFNGSTESEPRLIDVVLTKAEARGKPLMSAPDIGFERIAANRTLVIADGGNPSPMGQGAHAGTLSFEMSVGKQRVIVNCGAYTGRNATWRLAQRATAAHSTLVVEDRNSAEIREDGTIGATGVTVTSERLEADGNTWIDMSHDGYLASHDVVHRRRLYINASGSDIRGEDTLEGSGDHKFSIRFHLHPSVKASLVQDGTSVLLRLPDKSGWRMRCSGGIASLQESIYLGDGQETKRTEQIVIVGASQQGAAQVKWALTKLTGK
tara:strand:- start:2202 stop:3929 length:1728 start_codon:yes stop_codon:yes gene_type:complete